MQISDVLFMGSLILLIITCITKGVGKSGVINPGIDATGATTDLQMQHDHKKLIEKQDSVFGRLFRSYLFWISILGIIVSIVLSKI
jgi:hypothetical protein